MDNFDRGLDLVAMLAARPGMTRAAHQTVFHESRFRQAAWMHTGSDPFNGEMIDEWNGSKVRDLTRPIENGRGMESGFPESIALPTRFAPGRLALKENL
jgi:hypothetical protein